MFRQVLPFDIQACRLCPFGNSNATIKQIVELIIVIVSKFNKLYRFVESNSGKLNLRWIFMPGTQPIYIHQKLFFYHMKKKDTP
jgi:hypothetical protein